MDLGWLKAREGMNRRSRSGSLGEVTLFDHWPLAGGATRTKAELCKRLQTLAGSR